MAMFAKCLKNECDQEFRVVQDIAKEQVFTALRTVLRERHPRSVEGEIAAICESMRSNQVILERWAWKRTLGKLYKNEERVKIELKILDFINSQRVQDENLARNFSPPISSNHLSATGSQKTLFSPQSRTYSNRFNTGSAMHKPLFASRERSKSNGRSGDFSLKNERVKAVTHQSLKNQRYSKIYYGDFINIILT